MTNQSHLPLISISHKHGMTLIELIVAVGVLTFLMTSWMVMTVDLPSRFYTLAEKNRAIADDSFIKLFLNKHIAPGSSAETFYEGPDSSGTYYKHYLLKIKKPNNGRFWLVYSPCGDDNLATSGNPLDCAATNDTSDDKLIRVVESTASYVPENPVDVIADLQPPNPVPSSSRVSGGVYGLCTDATCPAESDPEVSGVHDEINVTPFVVESTRNIQVRFQHDYYHFRGQTDKPLVLNEIIYLNSGQS